jgi:hypothetical protein
VACKIEGEEGDERIKEEKKRGKEWRPSSKKTNDKVGLIWSVQTGRCGWKTLR